MDATDWAQVAIASIMLLSAFAALLVAYITYRSQPLLIRTKEIHSDDLKKVLQRWQIELGKGFDLLGVSPPPDFADFRLPVEDHILFPDLRNHIPSELHVGNYWERFRKQHRHVASNCAALYVNVKKYVRLHTCLDMTPNNTDSVVGIFPETANLLYTDLLIRAEGGSIDTKPVLATVSHNDGKHSLICQAGGTLACALSEQSITEIGTFVLSTLKQIDNADPDSPPFGLLFEAKALVAENAKLEKLHRSLVQSLDIAMTLPLLTGNCPHIKRAREPFWPCRWPWRWPWRKK